MHFTEPRFVQILSEISCTLAQSVRFEDLEPVSVKTNSSCRQSVSDPFFPWKINSQLFFDCHKEPIYQLSMMSTSSRASICAESWCFDRIHWYADFRLSGLLPIRGSFSPVPTSPDYQGSTVSIIIIVYTCSVYKGIGAITLGFC